MIKKLFWMWLCVTAAQFISLSLNLWLTGFDWKIYVNCGGLALCIYGTDKWYTLYKEEKIRLAKMALINEKINSLSQELLALRSQINQESVSNPSDKGQNQ